MNSTLRVAAINGSPNRDGNTAAAIEAMAEVLREHGVETEILQVGGERIRGCAGCAHCRQSGFAELHSKRRGQKGGAQCRLRRGERHDTQRFDCDGIQP